MRPVVACLGELGNKLRAQGDDFITPFAIPLHRFHVGIVEVVQAFMRGQCSGGFDQGLQLRSEEHTSALQSLMSISSAVFCLKNNNDKLIRLEIDNLYI